MCVWVGGENIPIAVLEQVRRAWLYVLWQDLRIDSIAAFTFGT